MTHKGRPDGGKAVLGPQGKSLPARKPVPRLRAFPYEGQHAYSLTLATHRRGPHFTQAEQVEPVQALLLKIAEAHGFVVWAYCFMPDHLHLLVQGNCADASLLKFIRDFKQRTSHAFRQCHGGPLWQRSYYDHVLRKDEDLLAVARYIFANPVRKGLVGAVFEYAFSGPPETLRSCIV